MNNKVLSWQDTKIEGITSYAYAVRPYKNVDGKKVLGGYQASSYILSYPELQKISSVRKTSRGLKICWKAQKKADCYQIYRKTGKVHGKRSVQFPEAAVPPLRIRPQRREQRITMRCVQG